MCACFSRCAKIEEMLHIIETYSSLGHSHIEGIELIHNRFLFNVAGMKKKPYDLLDQRKSDFDTDLEEFKKVTGDILVSHTILFASCYELTYIFHLFLVRIKCKSS